MKKRSFLAGGVLLAVVVVLTPAGAQDNKAPTIKQVMKKLNSGPNSMTATIGKELQDDPPIWDDIKKETQEYVKMADALGKNDPPKGEKDSVGRRRKSYRLSESVPYPTGFGIGCTRISVSTTDCRRGCCCRRCYPFPNFRRRWRS